MKTVQKVYEEYKIMPSLRLHQLRVAAVAKLICQNFKEKVDERTVLLACLFHDMGNIIKFDLTVFPDSVKPEGLEYWQSVQTDFMKRYGADHHEANHAIAKELELSADVLKCIDAVAFAKAEEILQKGSWEEKICEYSDSRVSPDGVVSLVERLEEGRKRYERRAVSTGLAAPRERFDALVQAELMIEKQLFVNSSIQPEDINDTSVTTLIEELREYTVA